MGGEQAVLNLPDFVDPLKKNRDVSIDKCIVPVIRYLWHNDIQTLGCCCGHGHQDTPNPSLVVPSEYTDEDIKHIDELISKVDNRDWEIWQWRNSVVNIPDVEKIRHILKNLTEEERIEAFEGYCRYCGQDLSETEFGICHCENDE